MQEADELVTFKSPCSPQIRPLCTEFPPNLHPALLLHADRRCQWSLQVQRRSSHKLAAASNVQAHPGAWSDTAPLFSATPIYLGRITGNHLTMNVCNFPDQS